MNDQGMTTRQVMDALNVRDPDTIYALHRAGKIQGQQLRRQWRFSRLSVERFLCGETAAPIQPSRAPRPCVRLPAVPSRY
jgi:hypothetical protein